MLVTLSTPATGAPMTTRTVEDLISVCQNGARREAALAFGELCDRFYPEVELYAVVGTGSWRIAEHIISATFQRALAQFDPPSHAVVLPWLLRIAHNYMGEVGRVQYIAHTIGFTVQGPCQAYLPLIASAVATSEPTAHEAIVLEVLGLNTARIQYVLSAA